MYKEVTDINKIPSTTLLRKAVFYSERAYTDKIFQGQIQKNWAPKIKHLSLFKNIEERKEIDFITYEKLHNKSIKTPILNKETISLSKIETLKNKSGYRIYS